jgi:hypothetical protein
VLTPIYRAKRNLTRNAPPHLITLGLLLIPMLPHSSSKCMLDLIGLRMLWQALSLAALLSSQTDLPPFRPRVCEHIHFLQERFKPASEGRN